MVTEISARSKLLAGETLTHGFSCAWGKNVAGLGESLNKLSNALSVILWGT